MPANVDSFEQVLSGSRFVQAPKDVHEGRFAAAAGTHDRDELACLIIETHATQRVNARFSQFVVFVQVFHPEDHATG